MKTQLDIKNSEKMRRKTLKTDIYKNNNKNFSDICKKNGSHSEMKLIKITELFKIN